MKLVAERVYSHDRDGPSHCHAESARSTERGRRDRSFGVSEAAVPVQACVGKSRAVTPAAYY
jgi:hypothetical protein